MKNLKLMAPHKYRIRFKYRDPLTGKQDVYQKTINGDLAAARRHRDLARAACLRTTQEHTKSMPLGSFATSFLTRRATGGRGKSKARATVQRDALALQNHILPYTGEWLLNRITLLDLEQLVDVWCARLKPNSEPYSMATVNTWIKTLRLFVRFACGRAQLVSPADGLDFLAEPSAARGFSLTPEQILGVWDYLKKHRPQHWAMAVLGFTTAPRFSELSALHHSQIDRERGAVLYLYSQYEGHRRAGTKSGAGVEVPLSSYVLDALDWHHDYLVRTEHPLAHDVRVFPARVTDPATAAYRGYQSRNALGKSLARAGRAIGLGRKLTAQCMRVSMNTLMTQADVNRSVQMSILGHSSARTNDGYVDLPLAPKRVATDGALRLILGGRVNEGSTKLKDPREKIAITGT